MSPRRSASKTLYGKIASAQEGRFMLAGDDGRMHLVVLAPGAGYEPQDLPDLIRSGRRVAVTLRPAEGCHASVAERLAEIRAERNPRA